MYAVAPRVLPIQSGRSTVAGSTRRTTGSFSLLRASSDCAWNRCCFHRPPPRLPNTMMILREKEIFDALERSNRNTNVGSNITTHDEDKIISIHESVRISVVNILLVRQADKSTLAFDRHANLTRAKGAFVLRLGNENLEGFTFFLREDDHFPNLLA